MDCNHCSCFTVKQSKCCYCHEGSNEARKIDEIIKKSIIKQREKKEKENE